MASNLTVKEVAEQLAISEASVYNLCATKQLAHMRIGTGRGAIRIPEAGLTTFIAGATVQPEASAEVLPPADNHSGSAALPRNGSTGTTDSQTKRKRKGT